MLNSARRQRCRLCFLAVLAVMSALLAAAPTSVCAQGAVPTTDAGQVKAHLREILEQPEFRPEPPDSPMAQLGRTIRESMDKTWHWVRARWNAFQKAIERLFSGFGGAAGPVASILSKVVMVLLIGFGGWVVAWLLRSFWITRRTNRARTRTAYDESEEEDEIAREPDAWIQQAALYAGNDDYRRAFRAVFVAILLLLDQAGLVEFDRARTNGDYLRLLRRLNANRLYDILDPLVDEFDRRWYGRAETGYDDYVRIQQTLERVRELVLAPSAPAEAPASAAMGKG